MSEMLYTFLIEQNVVFKTNQQSFIFLKIHILCFKYSLSVIRQQVLK